MASALTTPGKNALLDSAASWPPPYLSVHNVEAPTDDTTEPSGGSPAYARKAATWDAAASGSKALTGTYDFDIPAGFSVTVVGMWSALSGGTLLGYLDVTTEAFTGQGIYTLNSGSVSI